MGEFVMHRLFPIVCNMSLTASVVILAVLAVRRLLRRAPKVFSYALWAVVLFRLPKFLALKFYPSFAAMTFPFVICATALGKALACLTDAGWAVPHALFFLAGIEAALATVMVCYVLARYVHHIVHTAHAERRLLTVAQADANTATSPACGFGEHAVH